MRARRLSELVVLMQPAPVELFGDDCTVGPDVILDNRQASPGALFVAIPGERVDGHAFAVAAVEGGATAVLGTHVTDAAVPHLLVEDSVKGVSWLARGLVAEARARGMLSIGVTGSSGKTSTKDLLAQVLEHAGATVAPSGSQNNEIGVPMTACRIDDQTRFLVSEMGARGLGHIAWLTSLVGLDIGVVLNVGAAHVGEFGSIETTAAAKSEIVADLGPEGWAVLNGNDPACCGMAKATQARLAWFGEGDLPAGDLLVTATDVELNAFSQASFTLHVDGAVTGQARVKLGVVGRHQVANSLAAAAAAVAAGVDVATAAAALSAARIRSAWRMDLQQLPGDRLVLNDAYNANPDSMAAALRTASELIASRRPAGRLIAVLGDMLELGGDSADLHVATARLARDLGVDELVAVGEFAPAMVEAFGRGGRVATRQEAEGIELAGGDVLLVKASRGVGLEKVAAAVVARVQEAHQ